MRNSIMNETKTSEKIPLETIWELETQLLKEIIDICDKYSIEYYMWVGSALGAIKYGGMIPWDDDIDIAVPVNQMERLLGYLEELPSPYYVRRFEHGDLVIHPVAAIEGYDWIQVHVDIFPLYGISSDTQRQRHDYWRAYLLKVLFTQKRAARDARSIRMLFKRIALSGITLRGVYNRFTRILTQVSYDDAEYVVFPNGAYGIQSVVSKEVIGAGRMAAFRDLQVRVPEKTEEYLTQFFGEYMQDPKEFKREE